MESGTGSCKELTTVHGSKPTKSQVLLGEKSVHVSDSSSGLPVYACLKCISVMAVGATVIGLKLI